MHLLAELTAPLTQATMGCASITVPTVVPLLVPYVVVSWAGFELDLALHVMLLNLIL